jgi:hypothetical protein
MKRYFLSNICVAAAVASGGAHAVTDIDPIATVSNPRTCSPFIRRYPSNR